ncbi:MAG: uroporphyrinogen-III synthase [Comamonas sp.]
MQVIVTRPAEDATAWLARLRACADWSPAWLPRLWPLIDIRLRAAADVRITPVTPTTPAGAPQCEDAAAALGWDALMFVSANAVRFLAALSGGDALAACLRAARGQAQAWAVGPSTVAALAAAGWPADAIVAPDGGQGEQFDSEALWARVAPAVRAGRVRRVLLVRGTEAGAGGLPVGRDWLSARLQALGVAVDQAAVYERAPPVWTSVQVAAARAALGDGSVWLISSAQAADYLSQALGEPAAGAPRQAGAVFGRARCVATHPRVVRRLQEAGWGRVLLARAEAQAVAASIKSIDYAR